MKFHPSTTELKNYYRTQQAKTIDLTSGMLALQTSYNITLPINCIFNTYLAGNAKYSEQLKAVLGNIDNSLDRYIDCIESLFVNIPREDDCIKAVICLQHIVDINIKDKTFPINTIPTDIQGVSYTDEQNAITRTQVNRKRFTCYIDYYFIVNPYATYICCRAKNECNITLFAELLFTLISHLEKVKMLNIKYASCSIFNFYYKDRSKGGSFKPTAYIKMNCREIFDTNKDDFFTKSGLPVIERHISNGHGIPTPRDYIKGSYRYAPNKVNCCIDKLNLLDKIYGTVYKECFNNNDEQVYSMELYEDGVACQNDNVEVTEDIFKNATGDYNIAHLY